jgi:hypothetical protein
MDNLHQAHQMVVMVVLAAVVVGAVSAQLHLAMAAMEFFTFSIRMELL